MATSREREAQLFSSSPAHPSHTRTAPQLRKPQQNASSHQPQTRKNPLKRSASSASLLTPPGSPEKEKLHQHRSKGHTVSEDDASGDDDEEDMLASPGPDASPRSRSLGAKPLSSKIEPTTKRTTRGAMRVEAVGRIFMEPGAGAKAGSAKRVHAMPLMAQPSFIPSTVNRSSLAATRAALEQVDKMKLDSDSDVSPMLPTTPQQTEEDSALLPLPPAFRQCAKTPPRRPLKRKTIDVPVRDSPNNPFLSNSPPRKRAAREPMTEKPTLTYVFRGVKAVFRNPVYGVAAPDESHPSALPPSHPDFSPDLVTEPRLLFAHPATSNMPDSDDDEDEIEERLRIRPKRLFKEEQKDLSAGSGRGRGSNKRVRLDNTEPDDNPFAAGPQPISMVEKDRSAATLAMAHGPPRKASF